MILVIDAGNTRIKWGIHSGLGWRHQGIVGHDAVAHLAAPLRAVPQIRQAVISSVADKKVDAALHALMDKLGIASRWVKAEEQACGVSNGYAEAVQLGSDRWAALIAAWHNRRAACVVASAGTALTVDTLSSRGEFLGGLIVPGLSMMKAALAANTAGVGPIDGQLHEFPLSTGDAVHSGALRAMAGAVEYMRETLARHEGVAPALLLFGGDAEALHAALSGAGEIVDNLVLEGLVLIAKEMPG